MNNQEIIKLLNQPLNPARKVSQFSHFNYKKKNEIQRWLEELHSHNMAEISKQMRTTLFELAHLDVDADLRLDIAEKLRVGAHNLMRSLSRHYLSQSLVLDGKGVGIATMVQQLRGYCFAIYNKIVLDMSSQSTSKTGSFRFGSLLGLGGENKLALSIHRTINELVGLLFETRILYFSDHTGIWKNLNRLYLLAKSANLLGETFTNPTNRLEGKTSIENEYMRALILSISQTNRLRQSEIQTLYEQTQNWSGLIGASDTPGTNDLFLVDLDKDAAPMYITTSSALSGHIIYIHTQKLIEHLKGLSEHTLLHDSEKLLLRSNLVNFVVTNISEPLERSFARHASEGKLQVTIGLLAVHYHLAGRKQIGTVINLKQMIREQQESQVLVGKSAFDEDTFAKKDDTIEQKYLQVVEADIVNISPNGYRVSWRGGSLPALKTGELIALRESSQQPWQVGIIHWVQQNPGSGVDFGIEILSTKGTPCGVASARVDDPGDNFMRGILLPEVKPLNRPATIITPNFNFKMSHRIKIRIGSQEVIAKLSTSYLNSQSFHQYDFTIVSTGSKTKH